MKSTLVRSLHILKVVSLAAEPVRFSVLREALPGIGDSTLARLLRYLEEARFLVSRPGQGYLPGPEARHWLQTAAGGSPSFPDLADEQVSRLADAACQSAAVVLLSGEEIRIVKSRTVVDGVAVIGEGQFLFFEPDHAAALAILQMVPSKMRTALFKTPHSFIRSQSQYEVSVQAALKSENLWLDQSKKRPGICRMAVGFKRGTQCGAVFFCLTLEAAQAQHSSLADLLRKAAENLKG